MNSIVKLSSFIPKNTLVRLLATGKGNLPTVDKADAVRKSVDEVLDKTKRAEVIKVIDNTVEVMDLAGIPADHMEGRTARIFKPAREATQTASGNTKVWKIELDNRERWENPLMGWSSSGDPLSNISGNLDFACKEDAMAFCEKNRWSYDVEEAYVKTIKPKNYGQNFHWNKRTRIGTK
uniref:NADH dehydrogenase [ubiquinone] iron-sulfur protein 4, mitochondrial n=1 Tax=Rhabditophanes sp. KR3021 TaxID=114890 RepID=A0AC35TPP4_9BILA